MLRFSCLFLLLCFSTKLLSAQTDIVFEDSFDGKLKEGWSWRHENPRGYRFVRNALEILMEPFADHEAKNVLFRNAPNRKSGKYQIELQIDIPAPFNNQYQQAGLYWMQNDKVIFKFVREMIDGKQYVFPGKIPVDGENTFLRLTVNGDDVVAEYKTDPKGEYQPAFEGKLPAQTDGEKIGIQFWHGSATREYWVRLRRFRIFKQE